MTKKILIIFGTRPEAIKMAPVVLRLKERGEGLSVRLAVTAQHRETPAMALRLIGYELLRLAVSSSSPIYDKV